MTATADDGKRARALLLERLRLDLVGPQSPDELLVGDKPSDRYLTGILYPRRSPIGPEEDDKLDSQGADEDETNGAERESISLSNTRRPASAGLSFAVATAEGEPSVIFRVDCGTYMLVSPASNGDPEPPAVDGEPRIADRDRTGSKPKPNWQRANHDVNIGPISLNLTSRQISLEEHGLPGLQLYLQSEPWEKTGRLVTAALVNTLELIEGEGRKVMEEKSFFQVTLEVRAAHGTSLIARPSRRPVTDPDTRATNLLYRDAREFAVGHTCSAAWETTEGEHPSSIATSWLPSSVVSTTSPEGSDEFEILRTHDSLQPLSAKWLSEADAESTAQALELLTSGYSTWIHKQRSRISGLPEGLRQQATEHLEQCERICERIKAGAHRITADHTVHTAFRLANRAMHIQRRWLKPDEPHLRWYPFQLGFLLLTIPSGIDQSDPNRTTMDLLWFPTGGGKTEAYLGLVAMCLFHRRLRQPDDPDKGKGVSVFMRYTLRLLTTQQFQRATALILACEFLRRGRDVPAGILPRLGDEPFSIGLWIGDDAVANRFAEAAAALTGGNYRSPAQIERCPACKARLQWAARHDLDQIHVACRNHACELSQSEPLLPIWTVDDDIYRVSPSLLIGTVDKFAQVVRKPDTGALFGITNGHAPPDLIIQDELHLISGPLGTMTGLYEIIVDELCSRNGSPPKIIGSTATIRLAEDQVRDLFNRRTSHFPPPGIDALNSGFAVPDDNAPGRVYVGVTTAGRSAKFALQATSASLLQAAVSNTLNDDQRDPYWTLVTYFNSLRELGGAVVLMHDDVDGSIKEYARRNGENPRKVQTVEELTSRVSQIDVRDKLSELERRHSDGDAIDVLLASNMISVGVDIQRLGLMVVNGQPKGIAEYIQATSRVGRGKLAGLVVTIYNNGKARDRSHYESFATWHAMLYRDVEATSVTPFASRARDRALHAVLVGLVRHTIAAMRSRPVLNSDSRDEVERIAERITDRAKAIDPDELTGVIKQLAAIVEDWERRAGVTSYWNDRRRNSSLLMSAEVAAALRAAGRPRGQAWPTPNSMRNVEPGTMFGIVERLKAPEHAEASGGE
jgi:hypothetical protein